MSITLILIIANVALSVPAFSNKELFYKLDLQPYMIKHRKQWHRFLSHAFLHVDYGHLVVNMYVLYIFGKMVESNYQDLFGTKWILYFGMLYLGGILFSALPGFGRHQDNFNYHSVGASGAVSAVVYSFILMEPFRELGLLFIPGLRFDAIWFGLLYLALEIYLDRRGESRVAHSAHYFGGIFGFVFTLILEPSLFLRLFQ